MDASGKDSAITHVMSGVNPLGTEVHAFKQPSSEELAHDFLWRAAKVLPARGRIGLFNRSYYEDVIVVRVHPDLLRTQKLPAERITPGIWEERLEDINAFERHLWRNGTTVRKFFLHVSRAEQRRRLLERLDDPAKNWKFSAGDLPERRKWKAYHAAYEKALAATSTRHAPWYVIPADHKWFAHALIADIIVDALDGLDLSFPKLTAGRAPRARPQPTRARPRRLIRGTVVRMPLVALDHVSIAFGHLPLLDDVALQIEAGERVSVIGRNGTGKSTLLQIIGGDQAPDRGSVWRQPGLRVARLEQDVPLSTDRPVSAVVAEGLSGLTHDAAEDWRREHRVDLILSRLQLPPTPSSTRCRAAGGAACCWRARSSPSPICCCSTSRPIISTSTPSRGSRTFLADYPGAVVFVTHDRAFLQRLATRIVELDRGRLTSWPGDYATFLRRKDEWLANQAVQDEKFDKRLAEEEVWLRQGVKARRTRNEGRVRALMAMREERAARRDAIGSVRLQIEKAERSGQLVFEADRITKSFGRQAGRPRFLDARHARRSHRPHRPERRGQDDAAADAARGAGARQRRGAAGRQRAGGVLRSAARAARSRADGVRHGRRRQRHGHGQRRSRATCNAYLRDFLFPAERARSPVKALSGGERNRLLLARLFTRPANVLVLDEPTNDLDLETLELLEGAARRMAGHAAARQPRPRVSRQRRHEHVRVRRRRAGRGIRRRATTTGCVSARRRDRPRSAGPAAVAARKGCRPCVDRSVAARKLSYKEQREFAELPARIEALEAEQIALNAKVADPDFYKEPAATIDGTLARLTELQQALTSAYARWDELDSRTK